MRGCWTHCASDYICKYTNIQTHVHITYTHAHTQTHTYILLYTRSIYTGLDGEMEGIQKQQSSKRSLCEVISSEIGFLKRRSLNIMEAIVQLDQMEQQEKNKQQN